MPSAARGPRGLVFLVQTKNNAASGIDRKSGDQPLAKELEDSGYEIGHCSVVIISCVILAISTPEPLGKDSAQVERGRESNVGTRLYAVKFMT